MEFIDLMVNLCVCVSWLADRAWLGFQGIIIINSGLAHILGYLFHIFTIEKENDKVQTLLNNAEPGWFLFIYFLTSLPAKSYNPRIWSPGDEAGAVVGFASPAHII